MANARSLIVFYVLFFMFVGVTLPFLPVYYRSLGLEASQVGLLLSVGPLFALLVPTLWGQVADRTGRPGAVLLLVCLGSLAGFSILLTARTFAGVLGSLALFSFFNAATTTLIDSLALQQVADRGGSFARIRTWGSAGFVVSTLSFGFFVEVIDRRVVLAALALIAAFTGWALASLAFLPARPRVGPRADLAGTFDLLRQPQLRWLLVASGAHWVASAPYHGSLGMHFTALGFSPSILSLSASVAVGSEVLVFATWPRVSARLAPRRLLLLAFLVSALRWAVMGLTSSPAVLVALAALHGLSFGAFYVASISWVADRAPPASGGSSASPARACSTRRSEAIASSSSPPPPSWCPQPLRCCASTTLPRAATPRDGLPREDPAWNLVRRARLKPPAVGVGAIGATF